MKTITVGIAALVMAGTAGSASAQICAGFPSAEGQFTAGVGTQFPDGTSFGEIRQFEFGYNVPGPLGVFGALTFVDVDVLDNDDDGDIDDDDDNIANEAIGGGIVYEAFSTGGQGGPTVSVCPLASVTYGFIQRGVRALEVPVGVGIGATLGDADGIAISPVVAPRLVYSRLIIDDAFAGESVSESDTNFGVTGDLILSYRAFWVGGTVSHVFVDGADPTFGVRMGFRL